MPYRKFSFSRASRAKRSYFERRLFTSRNFWPRRRCRCSRNFTISRVSYLGGTFTAVPAKCNGDGISADAMTRTAAGLAESGRRPARSAANATTMAMRDKHARRQAAVTADSVMTGVYYYHIAKHGTALKCLHFEEHYRRRPMMRRMRHAMPPAGRRGCRSHARKLKLMRARAPPRAQRGPQLRYLTIIVDGRTIHGICRAKFLGSRARYHTTRVARCHADTDRFRIAAFVAQMPPRIATPGLGRQRPRIMISYARGAARKHWPEAGDFGQRAHYWRRRHDEPRVSNSSWLPRCDAAVIGVPTTKSASRS